MSEDKIKDLFPNTPYRLRLPESRDCRGNDQKSLDVGDRMTRVYRNVHTGEINRIVRVEHVDGFDQLVNVLDDGLRACDEDFFQHWRAVNP